jgi:hypothetical protein
VNTRSSTEGQREESDEDVDELDTSMPSPSGLGKMLRKEIRSLQTMHKTLNQVNTIPTIQNTLNSVHDAVKALVDQVGDLRSNLFLQTAVDAYKDQTHALAKLPLRTDKAVQECLTNYTTAIPILSHMFSICYNCKDSKNMASTVLRALLHQDYLNTHFIKSNK